MYSIVVLRKNNNKISQNLIIILRKKIKLHNIEILNNSININKFVNDFSFKIDFIERLKLLTNKFFNLNFVSSKKFENDFTTLKIIVIIKFIITNNRDDDDSKEFQIYKKSL